MIDEFLREQLELHFERSLTDRAVLAWVDEVQESVLDTLPALCRATAARLSVQTDGAGEAAEGDLVPMLSSLAMALDPDCLFHGKHRLEPLPPRFQGGLAGMFVLAEAQDAVEVRLPPLRQNPRALTSSARRPLPRRARPSAPPGSPTPRRPTAGCRWW